MNDDCLTTVLTFYESFKVSCKYGCGITMLLLLMMMVMMMMMTTTTMMMMMVLCPKAGSLAIWELDE